MLALMIKVVWTFIAHYCTVRLMALLINDESTEPRECFMHTLLLHLIMMFMTAMMMIMISETELFFEL